MFQHIMKGLVAGSLAISLAVAKKPDWSAGGSESGIEKTAKEPKAGRAAVLAEKAATVEKAKGTAEAGKAEKPGKAVKMDPDARRAIRDSIRTLHRAEIAAKVGDMAGDIRSANETRKAAMEAKMEAMKAAIETRRAAAGTESGGRDHAKRKDAAETP